MPSPRDVPTYDHKPQMSAREAADAFVEAWREDAPGFAIINFANADMVGHTGVIAAAVAAIETVDECLGEVVAAVRERGGVCVVTADHGNADHMLEPDGSPNTAHSLNPVPVIVTMHGVKLAAEGGILADVAPTVLELLGMRAAGGDDRPLAAAQRAWGRRIGGRAAVSISRKLLAAFWLGSGVNHFVSPRFYRAIVPPSLQHEAKRVVEVSGVAEIAGGLAVLSPRTRPAAGIYLIALLAAVFPANLYMAREPERFEKVPALGAVRATSPAAVDDVVGLAGHARLIRQSRSAIEDAATFG